MELPKASPVAQQGIRKQQLLHSQHPPLPSPLQSPAWRPLQMGQLEH